ncbi:MAG: hypothetical protein ACFFDN_20795 [Candidatus Hodarchaeota archaeon]
MVKVNEKKRARATTLSKNIQQLHVVATPVSNIFKDCFINNEKIFNDRIYLLSAHVEESESSGLKGALNHLSAHFSNVANYSKGKEISYSLLNKQAGYYLQSQIQDELVIRDANNQIIEEPVSNHSIEEIINQIELSDPRNFMKSIILNLDHLKTDVSDSFSISFLLKATFFLAFVVIPLISWMSIFIMSISKYFLNLYLLLIHLNPIDLILEAWQSEYPIGIPNGPFIMLLLLPYSIPILSITISIFLIYLSLKRYEEAEKDVLFGLTSGTSILILNIVNYLWIIDINTKIILIQIIGSIIFLNLIYMLGFIYPKFRVITIFTITLTLGGLSFNAIPNIIVYYGYTYNWFIESILFISFTIILIFLLGYFYNFMKGVEVILEIEYSFALLMGNQNSTRKVIKYELCESFSHREMKPNIIQRIINLLRIYFGFRPQGTIELHIPLSKIGTMESVHKNPQITLFNISEINFDGTKAAVKLLTEPEKIIYLHEFKHI